MMAGNSRQQAMQRAELFLLVALALVFSTAAQAETRQPVDLPAGGLGPAVVALGRQAGVSVGISDPELSALQVKRVRGTMRITEALDRLLKGTGAAYQSVNGFGWRIVRRPLPSKTVPVPSHANQSPVTNVEILPEIIVTASKRDTLLVRYAGSATVLNMGDMPVGSGGGSTATLTARVAGRPTSAMSRSCSPTWRQVAS